MDRYDIVIAGAGASGVFMAYELTKIENNARVLMVDKGAPLENRMCPIKLGNTPSCVKCSPCHIMNGYGGAGTLSDGKYNLTTQFGGDLHKFVGEDKAMELMEYVDDVLCSMGGADARLYSTGNSDLKTECLRYDLHLLEAKVRHLGTDRNVQILGRIFDYIKERIEMKFYTSVRDVEKAENGGFIVSLSDGTVCSCDNMVLATGRSGSSWISKVCDRFGIAARKNRVDIGVRVELPAEIFKHDITMELHFTVL